jgi:hypothetical protein
MSVAVFRAWVLLRYILLCIWYWDTLRGVLFWDMPRKEWRNRLSGDLARRRYRDRWVRSIMLFITVPPRGRFSRLLRLSCVLNDHPRFRWQLDAHGEMGVF